MVLPGWSKFAGVRAEIRHTRTAHFSGTAHFNNLSYDDNNNNNKNY